MRRIFQAGLPLLALVACAGNGDAAGTGSANSGAAQASAQPFNIEVIADFESPWAMTFLPDGSALVTEKTGRLVHWSRQNGQNRTVEVSGVPQVDAGGQGGLGDVVLHPQFASNRLVYLSFAEAGEGGTRGAAVGRGRLVVEGGTPRIEGWQVIWRQVPKFDGRGHYGHRIAFSPDGHLFISSSERQEFDPAQDMNSNAGKILRLGDDGSVPADNPFAGRGGVTAQIWSLGHRNPLGLAFAPDGRLWENEMGPAGGDEFNLIERGANYGYPVVSNGDHYDGRPIPDHDTRPELNAPEITWTPVISPSSLIFYTGTQFPEWRGNALIGGLSGQALVRVAIDGNSAREVARYPMNARIREVEQGPDGSIYLLEDGGRDSQGRLLRLTPAR
ncbi:MAG: PQQ-dependent sugar dehydrogenase [Allosphingosinicella sp.]|uniref:PQQ-dependent sugar dehydrogenase n=1 Tax=Allosphingosinicella sp. TaxID=2823234 RepID=UPI00395E90AA